MVKQKNAVFEAISEFVRIIHKIFCPLGQRRTETKINLTCTLNGYKTRWLSGLENGICFATYTPTYTFFTSCQKFSNRRDKDSGYMLGYMLGYMVNNMCPITSPITIGSQQQSGYMLPVLRIINNFRLGSLHLLIPGVCTC